MPRVSTRGRSLSPAQVDAVVAKSKTSGNGALLAFFWLLAGVLFVNFFLRIAPDKDANFPATIGAGSAGKPTNDADFASEAAAPPVGERHDVKEAISTVKKFVTEKGTDAVLTGKQNEMVPDGKAEKAGLATDKTGPAAAEAAARVPADRLAAQADAANQVVAQKDPGDVVKASERQDAEKLTIEKADSEKEARRKSRDEGAPKVTDPRSAKVANTSAVTELEVIEGSSVRVAVFGALLVFLALLAAFRRWKSVGDSRSTGYSREHPVDFTANDVEIGLKTSESFARRRRRPVDPLARSHVQNDNQVDGHEGASESSPVTVSNSGPSPSPDNSSNVSDVVRNTTGIDFNDLTRDANQVDDVDPWANQAMESIRASDLVGLPEPGMTMSELSYPQTNVQQDGGGTRATELMKNATLYGNIDADNSGTVVLIPKESWMARICGEEEITVRAHPTQFVQECPPDERYAWVRDSLSHCRPREADEPSFFSVGPDDIPAGQFNLLNLGKLRMEVGALAIQDMSAHPPAPLGLEIVMRKSVEDELSCDIACLQANPEYCHAVFLVESDADGVESFAGYPGSSVPGVLASVSCGAATIARALFPPDEVAEEPNLEEPLLSQGQADCRFTFGYQRNAAVTFGRCDRKLESLSVVSSGANQRCDQVRVESVRHSEHTSLRLALEGAFLGAMVNQRSHLVLTLLGAEAHDDVLALVAQVHDYSKTPMCSIKRLTLVLPDKCLTSQVERDRVVELFLRKGISAKFREV